MKVEVREYCISLEAENESENYLLETFWLEGARVFGRSSNGIEITYPSKAQLRQLTINREQQALLCYALGHSMKEITETRMMQQLPQSLMDVAKVTGSYMDLMYQLLLHLISRCQ